MKRKLIVALSIFLLLSVFGIEVKADDSDNEIIYPIPDDYVEPEHYYTDEEIQLLENMAQPMPGDDFNVINQILAGDDSGTFSDISTENMDILFSTVKTAYTGLKQTYCGLQCYKFATGNNVLYVPAEYMYRTTSGACSLYSFNTTMTNRLNYSNTNPVTVYAFCSYKFIDYDNNEVYRFNIAKMEGEVHVNSGIMVYTTLTIVDTVAFDVYDNFINCVPNYYTSVLKAKPTVTVKETNTGSSTKSLYLDGYKIEGKGESSSTTDISTLVSIGIKTYELYAASVINHDPYQTFKQVFDLTILLNKTVSGGRTQYVCPDKSLSNPSQNVYSYNCKTIAPFFMKKKDDYIQLRVSLSENRLNTSRFQISITFNITH